MFKHPLYNRPLVQVTLLGFVCLCCPGMFNALLGLGAGGSMSSNVALTDAANAALYGCFAIVGFFAGSVTNTIGVKITLTRIDVLNEIGSIGYAVYASAFWVYDRMQVAGFVIAAGAILGCCAGIFWSAQGAIMMAYPEEHNKGKYVAIFWALFNLGGIIGSVIALALNIENQAGGGVSTGTYTAFVIIMLIGVVLSLALLPPSHVVRNDGSPVAMAHSPCWTTELKGVVMIWREWRIIALAPAFIASNWFYAYQFRVNAIYFNPSTRALNDTMYWAQQVVGALLIGLLLDYQGMSRRGRGLLGLVIIFILLMAVWAGGFVFQLTFDNKYADPIHWTSPRFGGPFVLYMMYGFADSLYQTYMYWLMGAMSNDPALLARYAGVYKAMQSAGAAISFGIDAVDVPLHWECLICWLLVLVSFPPLYLVANSVTESNIKQDITYQDNKSRTTVETVEERVSSKGDI
ncbi:major facilitator superfamily domain-containing protein [Fennellomyces sp. T-0311]|nr:major facilitator superfamily domain-containing protein [Fennellomyces sp. T-0311]